MKHFEDFNKEAQQYDKILKRYKEKGEVFTDPFFHPNCNIKEPKVTFNEKETIWERIDKYYSAPLFKREAISENAIQQGELGTCYFIASLSRIARQPELVELLFDTRTKSKSKNQKGGKSEFYNTINLKCGAVIVYFHVFGRLTPVLIDTLIPFRRGTRKPKFCHPADIKYSPWFCLVEKAFAKLNGSYSLISGGTLSSAIYHLFGYFPCYKKIKSILSKREEELKKIQEHEKSTKPIKFNENEYLFSQLMQWQRENAVLGADIIPNDLRDDVTEDDIIDNGLVTNHAYLIMKVRREDNKNFICLRNPWGDHEWLGDWSDTSPLWTPELKKALGVHSKDDGTFWMIDKDFFKYFSSFDVAKPVNPEYHAKSFMTKLIPGNYDGSDVESPNAHLEKHQTFVFKLKDVLIKSDLPENDKQQETDKKTKKKKTKVVDDIKVYIRIEKRSPLYDSSTDTLVEKPKYALYVVYSDGKKLEYENLKYYNRYWLTTSNQFFRSTIHVQENKPFVIVFHRIDKRDFTEECYVQVSCKYDFDLYDADQPDKLFKEDEKFGVVFNNKSKRYSNISKDLRIKNIDGKNIQAFATLNTNDYSETFYKHLKYNIEGDESSDIYEYHISDQDYSSDVERSDKEYNSNETSKKEMKKIIEKRKKVEELEKKVQKEKKKIDQEKKLIIKKKEEIQKENEKLKREKKKFEEEKKKGTKKSPRKLSSSKENSDHSGQADDNEQSESSDDSDSSNDSNNTELSESNSSKDTKKARPIRKINIESESEMTNKKIPKKRKSEADSNNSDEANRKLTKRNSQNKLRKINLTRRIDENSNESGDSKDTIKKLPKRRSIQVSETYSSNSEDSEETNQRLKKKNSQNKINRIITKSGRNDSEDSKRKNSPNKLKRINSRRRNDEEPDSEETSDKLPKRDSQNKIRRINSSRRTEDDSTDSEESDKKMYKRKNSPNKSKKINHRRKIDTDSNDSDETDKKLPKRRNPQNKIKRINSSRKTEDDSIIDSEDSDKKIYKRRNSQNKLRRINSNRRTEDNSIDSEDSDKTERKQAKRNSWNKLRRINASRRNQNESDSDSSDSDESSDELHHKSTQKKLRRMNSSRRIDEEPDSEDSEEAGRRKPAKRNSQGNLKRAKSNSRKESDEEPDSEDPDERLSRRKSQGKLKRVNSKRRRVEVDDEGESDSEESNKKMLKRRPQNNLRRVKSSRIVDDADDGESDSDDIKTSIPKRKSLSNLRHLKMKRKTAESSFESDNDSHDLKRKKSKLMEADKSDSSESIQTGRRTNNNRKILQRKISKRRVTVDDEFDYDRNIRKRKGKVRSRIKIIKRRRVSSLSASDETVKSNIDKRIRRNSNESNSNPKTRRRQYRNIKITVSSSSS